MISLTLTLSYRIPRGKQLQNLNNLSEFLSHLGNRMVPEHERISKKFFLIFQNMALQVHPGRSWEVGENLS